MDAILARIKDAKASPRLSWRGYIGLEMVEAASERGLASTLVELEPQVMGTLDPKWLPRWLDELRLNGVNLLLNTSVQTISEENGTLSVQLSSGDTVRRIW